MLDIIDVNKDIKKLYMDAMYYHLIHKGYSDQKASAIIKRVFSRY